MTGAEILKVIPPREALIATLYGEAANQPLEGIVAVGCVIRNRAMHPRWWGIDLKTVCLAQAQFSCWWGNDANSARVYQLAEALIKRWPIGERNLQTELAWVAEGLIGDQLRDITNGCDHYLTAKLYRSAHAPEWAKNRRPVVEIGAHVFLRLEL